MWDIVSMGIIKDKQLPYSMRNVKILGPPIMTHFSISHSFPVSQSNADFIHYVGYIGKGYKAWCSRGL